MCKRQIRTLFRIELYKMKSCLRKSFLQHADLALINRYIADITRDMAIKDSNLPYTYTV